MAGLSHPASQWSSWGSPQAATSQSSNTLLPLQTVLSAVSWLVFSDTIMFWLLEARYCLEVISDLGISNGHTFHALQSSAVAPDWKEGSS